MSRISDQLALLFEARRYKWTFDDGEHVPNSEDIEAVLQKARRDIEADGGDEVQLEVGRLIVRKTAGHYDVYVYFGEIK